MSEITDKVAELEATEKQLQSKQAELAKSDATLAENVEKKKALDAELARVQTDITTAKEERRQKDSTFQERLRSENLETAKAKFFSEFKYEKPEDQSKFLDGFKKYDTQSVNPELIYKDMITAHVATNPERYIELERTAERLKQGGLDLTTDSAGSAFTASGGLPGTETAGLSMDEIRAAQWAGIPTETYKRLKSEGKID